MSWKPLYEAAAARADNATQALAEALAMVEKERSRYDTLLQAVLSRGLRDEKEPTPAAEPDKPLPPAIAQALSHFAENTPPYIANRAYAFAQLAIRPDDAEGIAAEIQAGEDIEAWI